MATLDGPDGATESSESGAAPRAIPPGTGRAGPAVTPARAGAPRDAAQPGVAATSPVFVGREAELARLARGLEELGLATIVGLAGVGKTALAQRAAAAWRGPVARHHVRVGQPLAELLEDVWRDLPGDAPLERRSDGDRIAGVAARLEEAGALAVIEDADRMGEAAAGALAALAAPLRRGRLLVTSRTRLYQPGHGPERVEVVLGGLDPLEARALWTRLDDLYGARPGFDEALERTRGNPFYLRRAHACGVDACNGVLAGAPELDADERRLALPLALVEAPLPRHLVGRLLPGEAGRRASRGLTAKLMVDWTGRGELVLHDLVGEAVVAAAAPDQRASAHRAIAGALEDDPLELVGSTRLRVRHLVAAGDVRAARDLLLARAAGLIRGGGAGELLRGLDRVTSETDHEARLARARVLARMLDLGRAHDELVALGAARPDAPEPLRASFAHLSLLTLRLDDAERVSRAGLTSAAAPADLRVRFATVYLLAATCRGRGDEARAAIDRAGAGFTSPLVRGYLAFARAFSLWLEERDLDADRVMSAAWPLVEGALAFRARVLAPTFKVSVLARAGKLDGAADALDQAKALLARFDDPLMCVSLRALRATLLESQGAWAAAADAAAAVEDDFARAGQELGALWARLVRARAALHAGQVRSGRRLLEEVTRGADAAGAGLLIRLAGAAGRADPWAALTGPEGPPTARPGEQRRARIIGALRSLAAGRASVARGYLAAAERDQLDPLERALCAVAERALGAAGADAVEQASAEAARAGADPELVPAVAAWLAERMAAAPDASRRIAVDRRRHTVEGEGVVIRLGRRPALRRLFYSLVEAPGHARDRATLARAIWGVDYRPVHDGALWVNVKRLRGLLAPAGLRLATDEDGVRLELDPGAALEVVSR